MSLKISNVSKVLAPEADVSDNPKKRLTSAIRPVTLIVTTQLNIAMKDLRSIFPSKPMLTLNIDLI